MSGINDKVWDTTFKILFQETPCLFLPLIKEAFGVSYDKKGIVPLDVSLYNGDGDLVEADNVFRINDATYHFEFQYTNDGTMAFRMWEYDIKLALRDYKLNEGRMEFDFPRSCVVYIARNGNYPKDNLELRINFQDGQHVMFKVPVIRLQDYKIEEIDKKKLWLFYPFMVLQYAADLKVKNRLKEEDVLTDYKRILESIETAYNNGEITIDEDASLLEAIQKTNRHTLKKHQKIMEGVENMVNSALQLKHKQIEQRAELSMLMEMKVEGVPKQVIVRIAKKKNIPEEEVNKILDRQE